MRLTSQRRDSADKSGRELFWKSKDVVDHVRPERPPLQRASELSAHEVNTELCSYTHIEALNISFDLKSMEAAQILWRGENTFTFLSAYLSKIIHCLYITCRLFSGYQKRYTYTENAIAIHSKYPSHDNINIIHTQDILYIQIKTLLFKYALAYIQICLITRSNFGLREYCQC